MGYNYSELLGKIKSRGFTQEKLAKSININRATLNAKLTGKNCFTTNEIDLICKTLNISDDEIPKYFFCKQSLEIQTQAQQEEE